MQRCFELAAQASGMVAPNPQVGAILVHRDRIIGEGFHKGYGADHAEVDCLNSLDASDRHLIPESTMYVNLEPCAHHGKTPPCALRLVAEKVKKVVICNTDPFAQVSGKGIQILEENGIATEVGIAADRGQWLNRRFFCFHRQKRPYIILKWAQTTSGLFAPQDRSRQQMSNTHSRQLVHRWRTEEAAILVGTNTALRDNPELNARFWHGKHPLRLVLDKTLRLPASLSLLSDTAPTWIVNENNDSMEGKKRYLKLDFGTQLLQDLMSTLHQENIQSVIVEGGAHTLHTFIEQGLWDEARILHTPDILPKGIAAPKLQDANHALSTTLGTDELQVFVNSASAYPYAPGMPL